jgi:predicted porin
MKAPGEATSQTKINSGGMTTSWWGMMGSEDLGGGLKAGFALTAFMRDDTGESGRFTGDTMFSRDANVTLSGGFGAVNLGRGKAPNFLPTILFNPIGDSFTFSPLVLHADVNPSTAPIWKRTVPADTGWSNQITYSTPDMSGLKANFHYQFGEQAAPNDGKHNVGFNAFYGVGPVGLTAYWERVEMLNPAGTAVITPTHTDWMLGGSFDISVVKLFATYGKANTEGNTVNKKTTSLGGAIPMGAGKILLATANTKDDVNAISRTTTTLGYDYALSKRTDAYVMFMVDKITAFDSANSLGVGIRHRL